MNVRGRFARGRAAAAAASLAALWLAVTSIAAAAPRSLVVCADPDNLPFSNRAAEGFENKIAALLAQDMKRPITYVWWPQARGFVRKTLNAQKCDLWPGLAAGLQTVTTTLPYYRSMYVFVSRNSSALAHLSLDDARLRTARIGVQMIGNDAMNSPPAHAIASRGIIDNVRGYMVVGDDRRTNPRAAIVAAVVRGDIDVALVWGPLAGYFAHRSGAALRIEPVVPAQDPRWPMAFDIAMGVRRGDTALRDQINEILVRQQRSIALILRAYQVPLD